MIEITDPSFAGLTCTPGTINIHIIILNSSPNLGYLLTRTKRALDVIDSVTNNFSLYNNDPSGTDIYNIDFNNYVLYCKHHSTSYYK